MIGDAQASDILFSHGGTSGEITINSATTTAGTAVDLTDFEEAIGILRYGAVTTAATQSVVKIEQSDDNSTYTTVFDFIAGATGQTAFTPADTDDGKFLQIAIDLRTAQKKYWRWSITTTGTPNFEVAFSGFIGLGGKFRPTVKTNSNRLGAGIYTAVG